MKRASQAEACSAPRGFLMGLLCFSMELGSAETGSLAQNTAGVEALSAALFLHP